MKFLEIRDRATYIPVVAVPLTPNDRAAQRLLRSAGWSTSAIVCGSIIMVSRLDSGDGKINPFGWGGRTMPVAHDYIQQHYSELVDGDVIDVEFILGETTTKKDPQ